MPLRDNQKRLAFAREYAASGNGTAAAIAAGVPAKSAAVTASRWLRNPEVSAMLRIEMESQIRHLAPAALKVLAQLIEDEKVPPSIRLAACRDVLDRAQYVAPKRIEARVNVGVTQFTQMSRADLEELVASRTMTGDTDKLRLPPSHVSIDTRGREFTHHEASAIV